MKLSQPMRSHRQKLIAALIAALTAFVTYLLNEGNPSEPEPRDEPTRAFGWIPDPAAVAVVKGELPCPEFQETEAFRTVYEGPEDVFLWEACRKATGDLLPARDQGNVGSCVAFGTASALEHLLCVQIASGAAQDYHDLVQEVIYGGSRVEVGGGRVNGDGSIGAWAAKFVQQYGTLPRGVHGSHDLRRYSEPRCREYGNGGVPDELEPIVRRSPVRSITNVRNWAECQAAIRNGYPIAVCSSQGFSLQRDADGFCKPQGTWYHCLALIGVRGGSRPGGFLLNSWGPRAHSGPLGPGRPSPAGFWVDANILDRMLSEGDSWAFSGYVGFPARKLDWYASHTVPMRTRDLETSRVSWNFTLNKEIIR